MDRFLNCFLDQIGNVVSPLSYTRPPTELSNTELKKIGNVSTILDSLFPKKINGPTENCGYIYVANPYGFILVFGQFHGEFCDVADNINELMGRGIVTASGRIAVSQGFLGMHGKDVDTSFGDLGDRILKVPDDSSVDTTVSPRTSITQSESFSVDISSPPSDNLHSLSKESIDENIVNPEKTDGDTDTPSDDIIVAPTIRSNSKLSKFRSFSSIVLPKIIAFKGTWKDAVIQFHSADEQALLPLIFGNVTMKPFGHFDLQCLSYDWSRINAKTDSFGLVFNDLSDCCLIALDYGASNQSMRMAYREKQIERNNCINKLRVEVSILTRCEQFVSSEHAWIRFKRIDAGTFRLHLPRPDSHPHSQRLLSIIHEKVDVLIDKKKSFIETITKLRDIVNHKKELLESITVKQSPKHKELDRILSMCSTYLKKPTEIFPFHPRQSYTSDGDILNIIQPVMDVIDSNNFDNDLKTLKKNSEEYSASLQASANVIEGELKRLEALGNGSFVGHDTIITTPSFPASAEAMTAFIVKRNTPLSVSEKYYVYSKVVLEVLLLFNDSSFRQLVDAEADVTNGKILCDSGDKLLEKVCVISDDKLSSSVGELFSPSMVRLTVIDKSSATFWDRYGHITEQLRNAFLYFTAVQDFSLSKECLDWFLKAMEFIDKLLYLSGRMTASLEKALLKIKVTKEYIEKSITDDAEEYIMKRLITGEKFLFVLSRLSHPLAPFSILSEPSLVL